MKISKQIELKFSRFIQKIVMTVVSLFFLSTCQNETKIAYKPTIEINDSIFKWLNTKENQKDSSYLPIYKKQFNLLVTKGLYDSAAKTTGSVGRVLAYYGSYEPEFVHCVHQLLQMKDAKIQQKYISHLYGVLGGIYASNALTDSAIFYLKKSLVQINDFYTYQFVADAEYDLSIIYLFKGMLDSSFYYSQSSFEKYEHFNMSIALGILVDRCGLNMHIGDYDEAQRLILQIDSLAELHKDSNAIFNNWTNKAYLASLNRFDLNDSLNSIYISTIDSMYNFYLDWKPTSLRFNLLAQIYQVNKFLASKNYPEAKRYLDSGMVYVQKLNNKVNYLLQQYEFTLLSYELKANFNLKHISKYQSLINRHIENREFVSLYETYSLLYGAYEAKNDYKQALIYKKLASEMKDSLTANKLLRMVKDLDKKYQTIKKEKQIRSQQSKISILLFSLIGVVLTTIIFFGYRKRKEAQVEIVRQQQFTDELMQNAEDERKRIASDLHDGVNHELLTLKNKALFGQAVASEDLDKVINEVRQVSRDLFPAMFDNIGLKASIETLCDRMTEVGLFSTCEINYTLPLSKRNELQLYRIIQEALNNTLKHAKADAAKVTIETLDNELLIEIKDNGVGFDIEQKMHHVSSFGLHSIVQRARAIGGKVTTESNEKGTKLFIKTPIP